MARRSYSPAQKRAALDLYETHGAAHAAKATGIPQGTIQSWASRDDAAGANRDTERAAQARRAEDAWAIRRSTLADDAGAGAAEALQRVREAIRDGRSLEAQRIASVFGVLFDRAERVGGPPPRSAVEVTHTGNDARAEANELLERLVAQSQGPVEPRADD